MRLLILGATGLLGHKLWQRLRTRFPDTWCTVRRDRASLARYGLYNDPRVLEGVDVADFAALERLLRQTHPDVVLNCTGITKRREPAGDPTPSIVLNALLPHRLAACAATIGARLIGYSTDCVFDGRAGGYTETSPTNAEDLYGRTKALGEASGANVLILRSSFIGRELEDGTELLEWFLAQRGRSIRGFRKALYTGVSTLHLADLTGDIIERHPALAGLYHVASDVISKHDLLCLARDAFGAAVRIEPDDTVAIRRNLDGGRLRREIGYVPPAWSSMMTSLARDPTPYDSFRTDHAV
jgi:dTDP-4-dehydrorhamnose reductase